MKLIVTADDFGLSGAVNAGIEQALHDGIVTRASLMANMDGFDEASTIASQHAYAGRIGVHLVLTEGRPLTDPIAEIQRFCRDGQFFSWHLADRALRLRAVERRAVAIELRAQLERCRQAGIVCSHVDSHHNVHVRHGVLGSVIELAREFRVPHVRIASVCQPGESRQACLNRAAATRRIVRAGLAGAVVFGSPSAVCAAIEAGSPATLSSVEVMTHPMLGTGGALLEASEPGRPLRDYLSEVCALRLRIACS